MYHLRDYLLLYLPLQFCINNDSTILAPVWYLWKWLVYTMQCSNWGRELLYNYLYFKRTLTYYFDKNVGTVSYFLLDIFFISQNYIANEMFKFKMMNYTFIHLIIIIIMLKYTYYGKRFSNNFFLNIFN